MAKQPPAGRSLTFKKTAEGVIVGNGFFESQHSLHHGGAWSSLVFKNGSGKNLIAQPLSSHFKFTKPLDPTVMYLDNICFKEILDRTATLSVAHAENGDVVVTSSGRYTADTGDTLPARYVRTTCYNEFGLVKTFLDVTAEKTIEKVVEFSAIEITLREGMNKAFVKHHPMLQQALEFQGAGWLDLPKQSYTARFMPGYVAVVEQNVEGIELFPGSDYYEWDHFAGAEMKGICFVSGGGKGPTNIALNPHCMAFRRVGIKVEGTHRFEVNFGIPFVKDKREIFFKTFQCGLDSNWISDARIKEVAEGGIQLFRFHNDYRENGPFWHDGSYPPYDAAGMRELKRVIKTTHKYGMKIIPYISLKEFHPDSPGYVENFKDWQRMESKSGEVAHTYFYTGEFGGLMCMKSGWLERRKQDVDTILKDQPWDGLYFDWCSYHPCCNDKHAVGWHTDVNEYIDFVMWCRRRIGPNGFLFVHLSLVPSLICENMADLICVGESSDFSDPEHWDPEYYFVPITQKLSARWGMAGKSAGFAALSGMLEGFPLGTSVPMNKTLARIYREYRLFAGIDMASYKLLKSSEKPVKTGVTGVWSNLYYKNGGALMYVANLTDEPQTARLSVDLAAYGITGSVTVETAWNELPAASPVATPTKPVAAKTDAAAKKRAAKERTGNTAPPPDAGSGDTYAMWQDENVDNGKVVRQQLRIDAGEFKTGITVKLAPLTSMLYRLES